MTGNTFKEIADSKFEFEVQKKNLKENLTANLTVSVNGGMFIATIDLMAFLATWPNQDEEIVILDQYDNPIKVEVANLLLELRIAYKYATNAYEQAYHQLKKVRNGKQL